ncbi:MAG: NPCBM/NEW2 domain-containing protein [Phycisphaeraceae bacterium]|nr:MAG: NPCBM/NEW2 domain-containing protein [Phycisphaeraceae bacterium]
MLIHAITAAVLAAVGGPVYLDSLDLSTVEQGWQTAQANHSVDGNAISIGGKGYAHGVGTHAYSEWTIDLGGEAIAFDAMAGVDDEFCSGEGTVEFVVLVDDTVSVRTGLMHKGEPAKPVHADLKGAKKLTLVVEDGGDGINYDHADWADARITMASGADFIPHSVRPPRTFPDIAMAAPAPPSINQPRITGATPGKPFLFRLPVSGARPIAFAASSLPPGLMLDGDTGVISGSIDHNGSWDVRVSATNELGTAKGVVTIVGQPDALALTPPMGWNSWNCWGTAVDDGKIRDAADWMVRSGLAEHGFTYINIDDAWEGGRDEQGRMLTNDKFPDMKALADYVHGKGLKLGIYSSPGPKTCAGYEGSYQHEVQDADRFAEWGIDLLKYDWCSYGGIAPNPDHDDLMKPYFTMRDALRSSSRDVVYSLCQYGMGRVWEWGDEVGGNYWRTTGDITDTWSSMSGIGFSQADHAPYAGPGHWNDPDMLVVGKVGWGPSLHDSRLTPDEQVTHITLWSMLAAPLLIGCDLTQLDQFTLALLTNDEVLAVSQDRLGRQATRVFQDGDSEVWVKPLEDGSVAVALFNRSRREAAITASWGDLGLRGRQRVRDLWRRADVDVVDHAFIATVHRHGAVLLRLTPAD